MIERTVKQLDSNMQMLLSESLLNPAVQQLFVLEKVRAEQAYLASFRTTEETDAQFLRKLAELKTEIAYINNVLALIKATKDSLDT